MMNRLSLQRRARYVQQIQEKRASVASICPAASTAADFFFQKLNFFNSFTTMLQTSCIIVQPQVKKRGQLNELEKEKNVLVVSNIAREKKKEYQIVFNYFNAKPFCTLTRPKETMRL
jgi:hypothetical protein